MEYCSSWLMTTRYVVWSSVIVGTAFSEAAEHLTEVVDGM